MFWLSLAVVGTFVSLVVAVRSLSRAWAASKMIAQIRQLPALGPDTPPGVHVKITGQITEPRSRTPFGLEPASYWRCRVQGEFETRRKKPGKGLETHVKTVHRASLDDVPILLRTIDGQVVHLCIAQPGRVMGQLQRRRLARAELPDHLTELALPKCKRYRITEEWYPPMQSLLAVGAVFDRNEACVTVVRSIKSAIPTLIAAGGEAQVLARYRRTRARYWTQAVVAALASVVLCGLAVHAG